MKQCTKKITIDEVTADGVVVKSELYGQQECLREAGHEGYHHNTLVFWEAETP